MNKVGDYNSLSVTKKKRYYCLAHKLMIVGVVREDQHLWKCILMMLIDFADGLFYCKLQSGPCGVVGFQVLLI